MLKRFSNLMRGFFGLFISGMERKNPEALLEVEKENLRVQIAKFNEGLAKQAGICERLTTLTKKQENEERDLRAKTTANLKAGNKDLAAQYALRLQTLSGELAENRTQLEQAETNYKDLVKARNVSIDAAKTKIEQLKTGIDDMKVKQAMAEMNEMASGMISSIGGSGDNLNRLQEMVEEERNKAAGKARVARDSLDTSGIDMKEQEKAALADQALAEFAAREGIALEPSIPAGQVSTDPAGGVKTMGPAAETTHN